MTPKNDQQLISVRQKIRDSAESLFGRNIDIEERAYQVLEVTAKKGGTPHETHIWASLAKALPAIGLLYEQIGFNPPRISPPWPKSLRRLNLSDPAIHYLEWSRALRSVFCVAKSYTQKQLLTEAGKEVKATGLLGINSLAIGILESTPRRTIGRTRHTNLVLQYLARGTGIIQDKYWDDIINDFSQKAILLFKALSKCDESYEEQQFLIGHDGRRFYIRPFGTFGAYQFAESPLPDGSLWVARSNVIQPSTRFSSDAIAWLEDLMNSSAPENDFQRFFEANPEFLLALGNYRGIHPQLILHEDDGGRLIPDFFLEKINSDFCDICDLKKPTADLIRRQHHRGRFRDAVMEGIAQLNFYRDWFEDSNRRKSFFNTYGLNAYRPRVILIIGRRQSYYDEVERIRFESNLPNWIELKTYDDVVERARQWRTLISD